MLAAAAVSFLLFVGVPVAAWYGRLSIGLLLAVALLAGTAAVFFQTAYSAYLPSILEPADQPEGNAKLHGSASAAQIAGLGAGGLIAQVAGAVNGLFANAATFLVSLLCLSGIRHREPRVAKVRASAQGAGRRGRRRPAAGRRRPLVPHADALRGHLQPCSDRLPVDPGGLPGPGASASTSGAVGGLIAAASTGGIAGAFAARRVAARIGTARATLLFELGLPVFALLMPLTVGGAGLLLYVAGGFCVSAGVVAGNVIKASFQQAYCPPALLGRLTASTAFLNYGTIPLGALLGGALGTALGVRAGHVDHDGGGPAGRADPLLLPDPPGPGPTGVPPGGLVEGVLDLGGHRVRLGLTRLVTPAGVAPGGA